MNDDPWLARWLPLIAQKVGDRPILKLGCGDGRDTEVLAAAQHVVAIDRSAAALAAARRRARSCEFHCQDLRASFPPSAGGVNVVVASLCLHYFSWQETLAFVGRLRHTLQPSGVVLCRLNASDDFHFGASGHPMLEENYYLVEGKPKRFFDEASIETAFANGWRMLHLEHQVVNRYARPKALWEVVAERVDVGCGETPGVLNVRS